MVGSIFQVTGIPFVFNKITGRDSQVNSNKQSACEYNEFERGILLEEDMDDDEEGCASYGERIPTLLTNADIDRMRIDYYNKQ